MNPTHYLACDLGATSGRVMLGTLSKGYLVLEEIHAFKNKPQSMDGHLCWDLETLDKEIFAGIRKAAERGLPISGLSADAWGVDYVLLDGNDRAMQSPECYRDGRGEDDTARMLKKLSLAAIYAETGIPLLPLHTLFQMEAQQQQHPGVLESAERFLPIADYLNTRFSGVVACEESAASSTQLYNPQTHAWSPSIIKMLNLPSSILPRLVPSGTAFGPVIDELRQFPALLNTRVIATCSHDTAAAIAAAPARPETNWAYLHSDTWANFGVERDSPIMSTQAREDGFTNEVGLGGAIHFQKNSVGLWLVDECRRAWELDGQSYSEEELFKLARDNGPAEAHIAPSDPRFREPGKMPQKVAAFCRETDQSVPLMPGEIIRTILESLALDHAETLRQMEALTCSEIEILHIVGRGSENELLNQLVADTTGLTVLCGPPNAAAIGNILIQALALWHIKSPDHLRSIVASSFSTTVIKPRVGFSVDARVRFRSFTETRQLAAI